MKVESTSGGILYKEVEKNPVAKKNVDETQKTSRHADSIEISQEAKMLREKNIQGKDVELIKQRISSNYYNKPEVLQRVADALIKEFKAEG